MDSHEHPFDDNGFRCDWKCQEADHKMSDTISIYGKRKTRIVRAAFVKKMKHFVVEQQPLHSVFSNAVTTSW